MTMIQRSEDMRRRIENELPASTLATDIQVLLSEWEGANQPLEERRSAVTFACGCHVSDDGTLWHSPYCSMERSSRPTAHSIFPERFALAEALNQLFEQGHRTVTIPREKLRIVLDALLGGMSYEAGRIDGKRNDVDGGQGEPSGTAVPSKHKDTHAHSRSTSPVGAWQPISSAPKDGTPVRLKWEGTTVEATGRWCPAHEWPKPFASDDWRDVTGDDVLLMPTHFKPLPAPPLAEAQSADEARTGLPSNEKENLQSAGEPEAVTASPVNSLADVAEMLWVVIANVDGSDWSKQTLEWQEAAARWRDAYFAAIGSSRSDVDGGQPQAATTGTTECQQKDIELAESRGAERGRREAWAEIGKCLGGWPHHCSVCDRIIGGDSQ